MACEDPEEDTWFEVLPGGTVIRCNPYRLSQYPTGDWSTKELLDIVARIERDLELIKQRLAR